MYNLPLDETEARDWANRGITPPPNGGHAREAHPDTRKPATTRYAYTTTQERGSLVTGLLPAEAELTFDLPAGSITVTLAHLRALLLREGQGRNGGSNDATT